jgi:sugar phosphate isomerase/epimerase
MPTRRELLAALPLLPFALDGPFMAQSSRAMGGEPQISLKPANKNVKWAVSEALWNYFPRVPFTDILDVMADTGFPGIRITGFPRSLQTYNLTAAQMQSELAKRNLHAVTISWNFAGGPVTDAAWRQKSLDSAREAIKFLADGGASHLVCFSPNRTTSGNQSPAAYQALYDCCNAIGELAGSMHFTAGLHNHMGQMVQTSDEIDRFMAAVDPKLFGLSPDTAHLNLAGCNVVGVFEKYKHRIHFCDYKDSRWTTPTAAWTQPNGRSYAIDTYDARFFNSIYDLGDGQVDFPGCHRVLKSVHYKGWICVDLDTARQGPRADYARCGQYIVKKLEPIYK